MIRASARRKAAVALFVVAAACNRASGATGNGADQGDGGGGSGSGRGGVTDMAATATYGDGGSATDLSTGVSVSCGSTDVPNQLQDPINGHNQTMTCMSANAQVAIYFDDDLKK